MKLLFHKNYVIYKFKENLFASVIGVATGLAAALLDFAIVSTNKLVYSLGVDYYFIVFIALYVTAASYAEKEAVVPGLLLALKFLRENVVVPLLLWLIKFVGIAMSLAVLPVGREGPAALLGTGLGQYLAQFFGSARGKLNYWGTIGAAAFVGAFLKTPLGATFYIFENRFGKVLNVDFIINALTASTVSYTIYVYLRGAHPIIPVHGPFHWNVIDLFPAAVLGVMASAVALLMLVIYELLKRVASRIPGHLRSLVALPAVLLLYTLVQHYKTIHLTQLSVNYLPIAEVSNHLFPIGEVVVAIILEIALLFILLAFGYPGGIILPLIFIGAALGNIVAHADPDKLAIFSLTGAAAMLCAAMNVPITAIVMISEMSHQTLIIPEIVSVITAYFLSSSVKVLRK
jgi:CIC family chloride channel protein